MSFMAVHPLVIDLSHWDPAHDFKAVRAGGYVGVIFKATQSTSLRDDRYVAQHRLAKQAGLKWGSYHFADRTNTMLQAENYLRFASPNPDELFALDWEEYGGNTMSADQVMAWVDKVESELGRPGQCVVYGPQHFLAQLYAPHFTFGARRTWVARYGVQPTLPRPYWLWQFTDGEVGPPPHIVPGVGHCDINSYAGTSEQLAAEWATGRA